MKIAVSEHRSRVAPVFDWSRRWLIIEENRRKEIQMETMRADSGSAKRAEIMIKLKMGL